MGAAAGSKPYSKVLSFLAGVGIWTEPQQKLLLKLKEAMLPVEEEREQFEQRWWTDTGRDRHRDTEWRMEGILWMISVNPHSPLTSGLTSSDLDDHCCHGDWQNKCDTSLLPPPPTHPCIWVMKWMWPQDQHAAILAKNQYFSPMSCIRPVSCNISIHMCTQSTLILPVCVCVRVREEKNAPLKQSLFLIQRRRKRASWLNKDWMSVYDGGFFVVLFCFSLNSVSHYCAEPQAVRGKIRTRATLPEPRGPQEPRGVSTLMEAWASLEQIARWGQKHTATTAPLCKLLAALSLTYTNVFPSSYSVLK